MNEKINLFLNQFLFDNNRDINTTSGAILLDVIGFYTLHNLIQELSLDSKEYLNPFLIKLSNVILYEIFQVEVFFDDLNYSDETKNNTYSVAKKIRMKIKQYQNKNYKSNENALRNFMGVSYNQNDPRLDIAIFYLNKSKIKKNIGTSKSYYNIFSEKDLYKEMKTNYYSLLKLSESLIKTVKLMPEINKIITNFDQESTKILNFAYSNLDIQKNSKVKNIDYINRLITIFDELGYILYLFDNFLQINKLPSFLKYAYSKIVVLAYIESVKNLEKIVTHQKIPDQDYEIIKKLLDPTDKKFRKKLETLRNNIHYKNQNLVFENLEDLNKTCCKLINNAKILHSKISEILNISPSRYKIFFYNLIRKIQS